MKSCRLTLWNWRSLMVTYHFENQWHFKVPVERVQEELENLSNWPTWSSGIRSAKVRAKDGELGKGSLADIEVKGPLPFTLKFTIEVTEYRPPTSIAFTSRGNLIGGGRLVLAPSNDGTDVTFHWHVAMQNPVFNFLAKLAPFKALMEKNHNWVMAKTYAGLNQKLRDDYYRES